MQPEFKNPVFIENNSAEEIHERMMANLPSDIDNMPGGFPYDFTMPAALEKDEFINFHMVRALMIAFPQYAWDEWLDLHGQQVHIERHAPMSATGNVKVTGTAGSLIEAGTIFCTPATETDPAIEFYSNEDCTIGEDGTVLIGITAVVAGTLSNIAANTICLMVKPDKNVTEVINPLPVTGGTEREKDSDYYDRISAEYENSMTYLGNDNDYIRWAKEAGAGDCIVISSVNGPGTVKLVLVDANGQPANETLISNVYNHIVSPDDRSKRLLPTACAELVCAAATTVAISYVCTGLQYDDTTSLEQIKRDFDEAVRIVYDDAKQDGVVRYNDVRPILSSIAGVVDFATFTMNGGTTNITLAEDEYPKTGILNFS